MRPFVCLIALLLCASAQAQEPRRDQELSEGVLRDHGYLFQLSRPDDAWQVLGEADAAQLTANAIAGLTHAESSVQAALLVEPARGVGVRDYAQLLLGQLELPEQQTERFAPVQLAGQPGVRYVVRGRWDGTPVRYVSTLVVHREHLYQLVCWGPLHALDPDGKVADAAWSGFRFLPGERVPGRALSAGVEDALGVGWRVRAGRFESAAQGLALDAPPEGWRLLLGDELDQLNDTAEVGLLCGNPELYLVLIPERAAGEDMQAFERLLRARIALEVGPAQRTLTRTIGGAPLELTLHSLGGQLPADYAHGVVRRGEQAVQILAWWSADEREAGLEALTRGLGLVRFLDGPQRAELSRELRGGNDTQNQVGRTFALRRGTYRDFALGFTWTQPEGFWRVSAGQRAQAFNPAAQLFVDEPALGLSGLLVVEETDDASLEDDELHRLAVQALTGPDAKRERPIRRSVGPVAFRASWLDLPQGDVTLRYLIATSRKGRRLFQLHVWGLPGNVRASEERVWGVLDGLQIEAGRIRPLTRDGEGLRDLRCGLAFDPPGEGWELRPLTQPQLEASGAGYQWVRGGEGITLIATCSDAPEQQAGWFERFVGRLVLDQLEREQEIDFAEPEACRVQGLPGQLRRGIERGGGAGRVDVITTHRDRTFYAVVISDEAGNGVSAAQVIDGLRFLD